MNKINLFFLISILYNVSFSQDVINLKDGNEIYAKIIKVGDEVVEYKKFSNKDGATFTKSTSEIDNIKFEDGTVQKITISNRNSDTKRGAVYSNPISPPENDGIGIAEVKTIKDIDVYILSDPLVEYKILKLNGEKISDVGVGSLLSNKGSIETRVQQLLDLASRAAIEAGEKIDGIIYSPSGSLHLIKYTSENKEEKRYAKVQVIQGKEIYVLVKPTKTFKEIKTRTFSQNMDNAAYPLGGYWTGVVVAGTNNARNSISDDFISLIDSYDFRRRKFDAIIYEKGYEATAIRFQ